MPDKHERRNLSLDNATFEALERIGGRRPGGKPNRSRGVRVAVAFWLEHHPRPVPDTTGLYPAEDGKE